MPNWNDPRGPHREAEGRDRWRREPMRERDWRDERRAFSQDDRWRGQGSEDDRWGGREGEGRAMEPRRRERYGSRYDQDRAEHRGYEDAGAAGYARRRGAAEDTARFGDARTRTGGEPYYGGQEYGLEGHPGVARRPQQQGPDWGFEGPGDERRRNFDWDDPGVGQSQAGYGAEARSHPDAGFDPDYLHWREEQLRAHDRDYDEWRREQHRQYDDEYRQFRQERQRSFGQAFHQWRSQRSAVGGVPDTSVAPGVSGYGDKTAISGGYNVAGARPSGALEPPAHLSADPAMGQTGGGGGPATEARGGGGPEFGREPRPVQSASEGQAQGHEPDRRRAAKDEETRKH